ncbi:MAG: hypothetical protein JWN38_28 [Candidatus Saccharibacteria bacterium]|nr:hypothetical protein [Candidatus Saccharibacteria bacterium]
MTAAQQIDSYVASLTDWRGECLRELRQLINDAEPSLTEEWKWGVPVWTSNGLVCAMSAFKSNIKLNFFKGSQLVDAAGVFNSGLDSKDHRSINLSEGDRLPVAEIQALLHQAIALNV